MPRHLRQTIVCVHIYIYIYIYIYIFLYIHQSIFPLSNSKQVYRILNNWRIWMNLSCGRHSQKHIYIYIYIYIHILLILIILIILVLTSIVMVVSRDAEAFSHHVYRYLYIVYVYIYICLRHLRQELPYDAGRERPTHIQRALPDVSRILALDQMPFKT